MKHMNRERYQRIRAIFEEVSESPREKRAAILDSACGEDERFRTDVEALLAHLDTPAFEFDDAESARLELLADLATSGSQFDAALPDRIGSYRILRLLGEGGMGVVYLAEQDNPRRQVAIKIIRPGFTTPSLMRRFEHEAQVLGRLHHPGIAQIFSAGTADTGLIRQPYLVMEYVDGRSLLEYSEAHKLSTHERLKLFIHICEAVQHAHQRGIIHRDLKPANILIVCDESKRQNGRTSLSAASTCQPKVLDFGVARASDPEVQVTTIAADGGQIIGTLPYMSPEQVSGDVVDVDTRCDVYALGVILFELLAGRLPHDFSKRSVPEITRTIREKEPIRLSAIDPRWRGDLDTIVAKALEKDKNRRYQTVREISQDIARHLNDEPILARRTSRLYSFKKFVRRNRAAVLAASFAAMVLVAATVISISFAMAAIDQRRIALDNEQRAVKHAARAEREAERALAAESQAMLRASELEQVAAFQQTQLLGIDIAGMGEQLRKSIIEKQRHAMHNTAESVATEELLEQLDRALKNVNFTDVARETIDENILAQTAASINQQFADQPLVRARLLHALSTTAQRLGLLDRAMTAQEQALAIRREELGDEHPDTLRSISNMGIALRARGMTQEAEPYYREALAVRRRTLGDDNPATIESIYNMAFVLYGLGRIAEAEDHWREALDRFGRRLGDDHSDTLRAANALGSVLVMQGRLDEAEPYFHQALVGFQRLHGDDAPITLTAISNMGVLLFRQGKLAEAEPYYMAALEGCRRTLGNDHPDTIISIYNMATLHQRQGQLEQAEPYFRDALERRRRVLGDDHPETLISLSGVASLFMGTARHQEAAELLESSLSMAREVLTGRYATDLGEYLAALGSCRASLQQFAAAEAMFIEAHELLESILDSDDIRLKGCAQRLIDLYETWHLAEPGKGFDALADAWRDKIPLSEPSQTAHDS